MKGKKSLIFNNISKHPLYKARSSMLQRCYNPNYTQYKDYGGRGISVCKEWIESSERFIKDISEVLGPKPTKWHSLDRIDNSGNYTIENLKWSSRREQLENTRVSIKVEFRGKLSSLRLVSELTGISYQTINGRYQRGKRGADLVAPDFRDRASLKEVVMVRVDGRLIKLVDLPEYIQKLSLSSHVEWGGSKLLCLNSTLEDVTLKH